EVLAGQFEWRITYPEATPCPTCGKTYTAHPNKDCKGPGPTYKLGTRNDVHVLNNFHVIQDREILIHLRSRDVLHSFYLPNLRLKQDAVPGMTIPVWFKVRPDTRAPEHYELMCAELCGWGHYKMRGQLTVHPDENDFITWLKKAKEAEERDTE
ncbi:hypothetical protein HY251_13640, partial [bacterium]|nr:hypothetical protein [bacterium]